jgi:hypothetical protein
MNFSIGCDPEIFLVDKHGQFKSAIGLIGGSKTMPRPIDDKGNAMLEDNVAVEFNIQPAQDATAFLQSIRMVMDNIRATVGHDFDFSTASAVSFPEAELMHPQAMEFGCEPDFNAWTKGMNPRPNAPDWKLRSCGGHIHVGFEGLERLSVIRSMDLFLGVPSTQLDEGTLRRELYGKAGCYRPKPYGAEYRTLSNFWIFTDEMIHWAYEQTRKAVDFVASGQTLDEKDGEIIQKCINQGDKEAYVYLRNAYGLN